MSSKAGPKKHIKLQGQNPYKSSESAESQAARQKAAKEVPGGKLFASHRQHIKDVKRSIKGNEYLILRYTDLIDPESHHSYAVYVARLDKEKAALQKRYDFLAGMYKKASNGGIPSLKKHNEELVERLEKLQKNNPRTAVERTIKMKKKVGSLKQRIKDLMEEIHERTDLEIEELIASL